MYFGQRTMTIIEEQPLQHPIGFVHFKDPPKPNPQLAFVNDIVRKYRGWCGMCGSIEGHRATCPCNLNWSY